jgi:carbon-monoxide dehydrogenase medium subunit
MHNFDFVKPSSIAEAVKALSAEGAQALSGGQTLIPTMKQRLAAPAVLVSLTGIKEMQGVCTGDGGLHIGAATPHAVVAREAARHYPALAKLAGGIGDPQVRNRGTIGGSLANNDPSACYPAGALASGATIVTNNRKIKADDYFQGLFDDGSGRGRDHHRGGVPDPRPGGLCQVRPARQPLCPGRGLRGPVQGWRAGGGDGGVE